MPFLKWVGGKTQILDEVLESFPIRIKRYIEPCVGGGSVLLGVLERYPNLDEVVASDINPNLIQVWKSVQQTPREFYRAVVKVWEEYNKAPTMDAKRKLYYEIRSRYNAVKHEPSLETAVWFFYMNKMGFRGMYRENQSGEMNIPFGNYKKTPALQPESYWVAMSRCLERVRFECLDVQACVDKYRPQRGDLVYCDPPYVPESLSSFTSYTKQKIDEAFHTRLFETLEALRNRGVGVVMSNAAVPLVMERFREWNCETIECRRAIHSKNPGATAQEVIVSSFPTLL